MTTGESATARWCALQSPAADAPHDLNVRHGVAWAACDDGIAAMPEVAESLCDVVDLRAGWKVLDIGNGTCSGAAARRGCEVTAQPHAEALPFAAGAFDVVLSMFGVMFAANQVLAASEMLRVCRHDGRIGIANWTPRGFMGRLFTLVDGYSAPPAGLVRATLWGLDDHLERLFGASAWDLHTNDRDVVFRYGSAKVFVNALRTCGGPVREVFAGLSARAQRQLEQDLLYLVADFNISSNSTVVLPSEYVEVVVLKK